MYLIKHSVFWHQTKYFAGKKLLNKCFVDQQWRSLRPRGGGNPKDCFMKDFTRSIKIYFKWDYMFSLLAQNASGWCYYPRNKGPTNLVALKQFTMLSSSHQTLVMKQFGSKFFTWKMPSLSSWQSVSSPWSHLMPIMWCKIQKNGFPENSWISEFSEIYTWHFLRKNKSWKINNPAPPPKWPSQGGPDPWPVSERESWKGGSQKLQCPFDKRNSEK